MLSVYCPKQYLKYILKISYISLPKSNVKIAHSMILVTVIL